MSNLTQRILVALVTIPLIVYCSLMGGFMFWGMVVFIALMGLYEFYLMSRKKGASPQVGLGLVFGFCILCLFMYEKLQYTVGSMTVFDNGLLIPGRAELLLIFMVVFIPLILLAELFRNKGSAIINTATTVFGVFYVVFLLGTLVGVRELFTVENFSAWQHFQKDGIEYSAEMAKQIYSWGGATVITVFVSIWMCDSLAYFAGKFLGKHKLFERVSPKKTWEGAIAGYVGAVAVFMIAQNYFLPYMSLGSAFVCGSIVGIFGQLGDLVESLLKRDAGVKDSSALIPGHGGVLDRFDSLIFVSPLLFLYLSFVVF